MSRKKKNKVSNNLDALTEEKEIVAVEKKKNFSQIKEPIPLEEIGDEIVEDIISLFGALCKPFDEGKGEKEEFFKKLLKEFDGAYESEIGIVVPSITEEPAKVMVSHMDLISTFNRGFKKDKKYKIWLNEDNEKILMGALDNTFTNAVLIKSIFELREQGLAQDVTFVFTEREEIDFGGMKAYLRKYGNNPLFINMDVTPDNRKFNCSIEYDEPNWDLCKQMQAAANAEDSNFTFGFTTDRVGDDLDAVLRANGKGFSYCIPTWRTIHSYNNYTLISNIRPYYEGLLFLIRDLDLSSGYEPDVEELSLSKALSFDTKKKFEKAEKKAAKKRAKRYSSKNYYDSCYESSEYYKEYSYKDISSRKSNKEYFGFSNQGIMTEDEFFDSINEDFQDFDYSKKETRDLGLLGDYNLSDYDLSEYPNIQKCREKFQSIKDEIKKRGYPYLKRTFDTLWTNMLNNTPIDYDSIYVDVLEDMEELNAEYSTQWYSMLTNVGDDPEEFENFVMSIFEIIIETSEAEKASEYYDWYII